MKNFIVLFLLTFSATAFSEQATLTVPVPKGATMIVVKALGVEADFCNDYYLQLTDGYSAADGYDVTVVSTKINCPLDGLQEVDLVGTAMILENIGGNDWGVQQVKKLTFTYDSEMIPALVVKFQ